MIKWYLQQKISKVLSASGTPLPDRFPIDIPNNAAFGDFSTNVAFMLTKTLKRSPKLIAEQLIQVLSNDTDLANKVSFSSVNGFINMSISANTIWDLMINELPKKPEYPKPTEKTLLEFVSANPTGPLHIGHGRWAAIGSVLANLYKFFDWPCETEFYINDAGVQINNLRASIDAVKQNKPIPENGYHGAYIKDVAAQSEDAVQILLNDQKTTLTNFRSTFDTWFLESSLHKTDDIAKAIEQLTKLDLTYREDGALWFSSSKFGDEKDRVLIKADGHKTYFAVDIAYHWNKLQRGFTHLINIWGADHHGYVPRMKAAIQAIAGDEFDSKTQFQILIGQLVSLFRDGQPVKMSKRTGDIITLQEVMDEIGVDATRFFLVNKSPDTHLDFDLDLAKKKSNENPVFYIQYAHARICSIFNHPKTSEWQEDFKDSVDPSTLNDDERVLILKMLQVYDEIFNTAQLCLPHKLATYTYELAKSFHNFYEKCPILKADLETQKKRLVIIRQCRYALRICLDILGISAPESM